MHLCARFYQIHRAEREQLEERMGEGCRKILEEAGSRRHKVSAQMNFREGFKLII